MEIAVTAGAGGGGLLWVNKLGFISLPLKRSNNKRSYISIITTMPSSSSTSRYSISNRRKDSNDGTFWSKKLKFNFEKNKDLEGEEDSRRKRRKRRRWWSDKPPVLEEEEEAPGILEEFIDSVWILEVLKSYGWGLPPIIISWLIATGPKAFLMTLAIPIGQSVITFIFTKLRETTTNSNPKRKAKKIKRRRPFATSFSDTDDDEEEELLNKSRAFRSWVGGGDGGSVDKERPEGSYFGGWDELELDLEEDGMESMRIRRRRRVTQSQKTPSSTNGRLGKTSKSSDVPLLLKFLIAVSPFLDSWTNLL